MIGQHARFAAVNTNAAALVKTLLTRPGQHFQRDRALPGQTGLRGIEIIAGTGPPPTRKAAVNRIVNAALDSNNPRRPNPVVGPDANAHDG